ncbi:MAG: phage holin family protein [Anaerolineae bacterium]|nr:phage holin family protein [Anaerolineae bacterium]
MRRLILSWLVNAVSLFVVASVLPGVTLAEGITTLLLVALLIGLINAVLRPLLYFASCGLIVLTLGLIIPILNALLLLLADRLAGDRFEIAGIGWAIIAALMMGVINAVLTQILAPEKEKKDKDKGPYVINAR